MTEIFQPYLRIVEEEGRELEPGIFDIVEIVLQDLLADICHHLLMTLF